MVYGVLGAQEMCENRGGRPGFPVPNSLYGLCGRKATLNERTKAHDYCGVRSQTVGG